MRIDPSGEFWWIAVSAILGGINSHANGEGFWSGAFVGAVSGAISWGASSAVSSLFSNVIQNMWTNLAVNVGSGALSSGLVNEAMGGDFWSGAKHGALSGAVTTGVSWGMSKLDSWFNGGISNFANRNQLNGSLVNGMRNMISTSLEGGNAGSGFASGFAYSAVPAMGQSIVNRYYYSEGTGSDFNPNAIEKAVLLNNTRAVAGAGHVAVLLIDSNGRGMYYSYGPDQVGINLGVVDNGFMKFKELSAEQVTYFEKTGSLHDVHTIYGEIVQEQHYNRFLEYKIGGSTGIDGYKMYKTATDITLHPGFYVGVGHSCENVALDIFKAGGLNLYYSAVPNISYESSLDKTNWSDAWKVVRGVQYRGYEDLKSRK
jgi:hypothetical protein